MFTLLLPVQNFSQQFYIFLFFLSLQELVRRRREKTAAAWMTPSKFYLVNFLYFYFVSFFFLVDLSYAQNLCLQPYIPNDFAARLQYFDKKSKVYILERDNFCDS